MNRSKSLKGHCLQAIPLLLLCGWAGPVVAGDDNSPPPPASGRKVAIALPRTKGAPQPKAAPVPVTIPTAKSSSSDTSEFFPQATRGVKRLAVSTPMTPPPEIVKAVTDASRFADQMAKSSSLGAPAQFIAWTISSVKHINSMQMTPISSPHLSSEKWSLPDVSARKTDR